MEKEFKVISVIDFLSKIKENHISPFRGVSKEEYPLIPKIGRLNIDGLDDDIEKFLLTRFQKEALPYLNYRPKNNWEWLALAQHHGLATRLLDWTTNPLVALYFAVEKDYHTNCVVYGISIEKDSHHLNIMNPLDIAAYPEPFDVHLVCFIYPPHITLRLTAQSGIFTIHPAPLEAYDSDTIVKFIVPVEHRVQIRKDLYNMGINRVSLFPDLDGLSYYLNETFK